MRENRYFKGLELESIVESSRMSKPYIYTDESKIPDTPDALVESVKACINEMNAESIINRIYINESTMLDRLKKVLKSIRDFFMRLWDKVMGYLNKILKKKPKVSKGPIVNPETNNDKQPSSNADSSSDTDDALDKFGSNKKKNYEPSPADEPFVIKIESNVYARNEIYLKYKEKCRTLGIEENIFSKLKSGDMNFIKKQVDAYEKLTQASDNGEFSEDKLGSPIVYEYNGLDESSKQKALSDYNKVVELVVGVSVDFTVIKTNMTQHGGTIKVDIQPGEVDKEEAIIAISKMEQKRIGTLYHIVGPMVGDMERLHRAYVKHNLLDD